MPVIPLQYISSEISQTETDRELLGLVMHMQAEKSHTQTTLNTISQAFSVSLPVPKHVF